MWYGHPGAAFAGANDVARGRGLRTLCAGLPGLARIRPSMRWILLILSAASVALGLLTVLPVPHFVSWRLAVLACDFGYALALIPLLVVIASCLMSSIRGAFAGATRSLGVVGFALLLQPCMQARAIAGRLPAELERHFGAVRESADPFTFGGLLRGWPAPVPKRTLAYSGALRLDFYPASGRALAPCVIVIHGGGWDNGDRGQIAQFNDGLARSGYAVADISYRLAPAAIWPAQREDVAAAIAYIKAHAGDLGVDASRLVLFGRSAGGQIAEACAYGLGDPSLRGVVALYAPSDMHFAWKWGKEDDALNSPSLLRRFLGGTPDTAGPAYDSASAIRLVGPHSPPTLLIHGSMDTLVWDRHSARLAERLSEAGVPNLLVSMPWATHALELNPSSPSGQLTQFAVLWFLDSVCR